MTDTGATDSDSTESVVIERTFDAPMPLAWAMWTDADHFAAWYGPTGARIPVATMDVTVGGKRHVCMEMNTPNGAMQMWFVGEYLEVSPHTRLVYTESMSNADGRRDNRWRHGDARRHANHDQGHRRTHRPQQQDRHGDDPRRRARRTPPAHRVAIWPSTISPPVSPTPPDNTRKATTAGETIRRSSDTGHYGHEGVADEVTMGNGACMSVINEMVGQTRDWVVGHRLHDLPTPKLTPMLAAKWLVDEWALQIETTNSRLRAPSIDFRRRQPEICWYEGSHLSFPLESKVTRLRHRRARRSSRHPHWTGTPPEKRVAP